MGAWYERTALCMRDAGWRVFYEPQVEGLNLNAVPADQRNAAATQLHACEQESGPAPNSGPMTSERASAEYDLALGQKSCLEKMGFASNDQNLWMAFGGVA